MSSSLVTMPTIRYCPCCDAYTAWLVAGDCELCESDGKYWHATYVVNKQYAFKVRLASSAFPVMYSTNVSDRVHFSFAHGKRRDKLLGAMVKEAENGVFDPALWAPTFPIRTGELVVLSRMAVGEALRPVLPPVLVRIVCEYFMAS